MGPITHEGEGRLGCLLLHGLTGTTEEVAPIAERLATKGWAIEAPLLPGHGTRVEDLRSLRWADWYAAALAAWDRLGERTTDARFAAGVSMGALLTLHLAHERSDEVAAIALLAPALVLRSQRRADLTLWLSRLPWLPAALEIVPKGRNDRISKAYDRIATRAVAELVRLQRTVRAELAEIRTPTLLLEGDLDLTVAIGTAEGIERALGSSVKRRRLLAGGRHVLTEGEVAAESLAEVARFFDERARLAAPARAP
jgi:carboxylesterase